MNLRSQIEEFEGRRHEAYPDPLTGGDPWTIGIGHTGPEVHKGLVWTDEQINAAFDADVEEARQQCKENFPWFDSLTEPRQAVLIGMCFQLGLHGTLQFKRTLSNVRDEHYATAAENMRQSQWAQQTPRRVNILAHQMETGEWA